MDRISNHTIYVNLKGYIIEWDFVWINWEMNSKLQIGSQIIRIQSKSCKSYPIQRIDWKSQNIQSTGASNIRSKGSIGNPKGGEKIGKTNGKGQEERGFNQSSLNHPLPSLSFRRFPFHSLPFLLPSNSVFKSTICSKSIGNSYRM